MKTIFSALFLLMATFAFAQSPKYTYVDSKSNTYEYYTDGQLKYIPASGTGKTVELNRIDIDSFDKLFKSCIDAISEQGVESKRTSTIKWKNESGQNTKVNMKSGSATRTSLENALIAKIQ